MSAFMMRSLVWAFFVLWRCLLGGGKKMSRAVERKRLVEEVQEQARRLGKRPNYVVTVHVRGKRARDKCGILTHDSIWNKQRLFAKNGHVVIHPSIPEFGLSRLRIPTGTISRIILSWFSAFILFGEKGCRSISALFLYLYFFKLVYYWYKLLKMI